MTVSPQASYTAAADWDQSSCTIIVHDVSPLVHYLSPCALLKFSPVGHQSENNVWYFWQEIFLPAPPSVKEFSPTRSP